MGASSGPARPPRSRPSRTASPPGERVVPAGTRRRSSRCLRCSRPTSDGPRIRTLGGRRATRHPAAGTLRPRRQPWNRQATSTDPGEGGKAISPGGVPPCGNALAPKAAIRQRSERPPGLARSEEVRPRLPDHVLGLGPGATIDISTGSTDDSPSLQLSALDVATPEELEQGVRLSADRARRYFSQVRSAVLVCGIPFVIQIDLVAWIKVFRIRSLRRDPRPTLHWKPPNSARSSAVAAQSHPPGAASC